MKIAAASTFLVILLVSIISVQSVAYAYTNTKWGFSMNPPSGWTVSEGTSMTAVYFLGPQISETGGNVNINVQAVEDVNSALSEIVSASKISLQNSLDNFALVSENNRVVAGYNCYVLVMTFTLGNFGFKCEEAFFVENNKEFVIVYTALPSNFDTYLSEFEQSLQTFRVISGGGLTVTTLVAMAIVIALITIGIIFVIVRRKRKLEQPQTPVPSTPSSTITSAHMMTGPRFCRYCGAQNTADTVFCENCGRKVAD